MVAASAQLAMALLGTGTWGFKLQETPENH